jgi:hypothetical protein
MPDVLPGVTCQKTTNEIPVEFNRSSHPDHSRMGSPCMCILLVITVGSTCSLECSMRRFLIASSLRYLLKSRSKKIQSIRLRARRCEGLQGYKALSMNLIKTTQRATMMAKPNKVVNNSVPFPIAYSFLLSNLRSFSFDLFSIQKRSPCLWNGVGEQTFKIQLEKIPIQIFSRCLIIPLSHSQL